MVGVALAQPGQEARHVAGAHVGDRGDAQGAQRRGVPAQVTLVRRDGVRGQATLDRQVVEVAPGRRGDGGQLSTSASGL
jgi:hypothetical protein